MCDNFGICFASEDVEVICTEIKTAMQTAIERSTIQKDLDSQAVLME